MRRGVARNGKRLEGFALHASVSLGRSHFSGKTHRSDILALGTVGDIGAEHPSIVEAIASHVFPNSTVEADPTTVRVACVGAAGSHILTTVVVHHNPQLLSRVDGDRLGQCPFNEAFAARASIRLRVEQSARSIGTALVDHDGTSVGRIVIHAHLGNGVAGQHGGREHDAPVEGAASRQTNSINIGAIVIVHPTGLCRFGLSVEGDVVDIEAVVTRGDDIVLSVFPLEGVVTSGDGELLFAPVAFTGVGTHLDAIDVEVTVVPALFAGDLSEEAHFAVGRNVDGHLHDGA